MSKKSALFVSLLSALCILLFQNCGGGISGGEFSSIAASSSSNGDINREAPRLLSIPSNQSILIGEGSLSGSTEVKNLLVKADAGPNESLSNQVVSLNCSASKNTIQVMCNGNFDSNGELRISVRHRDNTNNCDSGSVTVTLEAEDNVSNNPDSPTLTSSQRTFNVQMTNNCLNFHKRIPESAHRNSQANFGAKLASDGLYLAVAAPGDDSKANDAGAIHIYKKESGNWNFKQKIDPPSAAAGDKVEAVAIHNNHLIIGNPFYYDDVSKPTSGIVHIYERSGETWNHFQSIEAAQPNAEGYDKFGAAVAINGNWALVGTPQDVTNNVGRGAVYVYKRGTSSWDFHSKIINNQAGNYDEFGKSLAMNANQFIVGAPAKYPGNFGTGKAYIYSLVNDSWNAVGQLLESNGKSSSYFADSVAIDGNFALVGAKRGNGNQTSSGSAYVYRKNNNNWTFLEELNASDGNGDDEFGVSVSISGNDIVIGARKEDSGLDKQGAAYHYKWNGSSWNQTYKIFARDRENRDYFGTSVVTHNGFTVVGSHLDDGENNNYIDGLGAFYSLELK